MNTKDLLLLRRARAFARSGLGRSVRETSGYSLAEIAESVGVAVSTIYHWETDQRIPRGRAAVRWARLIETLRDDLRTQYQQEARRA